MREKRLEQLYRHTEKSKYALLLITLLISFFIYEFVPSYLLYPWMLASILIVLSRVYDSIHYLKCLKKCSYVLWYWKFYIKVLLSAALWGSMPFLFFPYVENLTLQFFMEMMIFGLSGGAIISFFPDKRIAISYLVVLLLPMSLFFILQGTALGFASFFIMLVYLLTIFSINKSINITMVETYEREEELLHIKDELFNKQEELHKFFQQTPIGVFYFDQNLRVLDCNAILAEMLHSTSEKIIDLDLNTLPDKRAIKVLKKTLTEGMQVYLGSYHAISGMELWVEARSSPLIDSSGKVIGGIGLLQDKTNEKAALVELEYMAKHDDLTSLKNRRSFKEYMVSLVQEPLHENHYSVLFYLDLNGFKQINDSLGHAVGDQLLIQVAERLKGISDEKYTLYRLGGDEFTLIMPFCASRYNQAQVMTEMFAKKIKKIFLDAFIVENLHLYMKSSIGIVIIEPGMTNIEELIRYADISIYQAKKDGINRIAYYNQQLDQERKSLFNLQHDLNYAITNGELELFYQPVVNILDDTPMAAEALVRWNHPTKGYLMPSAFIDLAVESGLINELGWWVIQDVCMEIGKWKKKGIHSLAYISININARQLQEYLFVDNFISILETYGVEPSEIMIEITERSLIDNFEQTNGVIKALQDRGVKCAIDDFGVGYSSLSYLQKLSFSMLKIDREFIKDILTNTEDSFLVETIILIAKRFNYKVIVEGIETEEQRNFIKKIDPIVNYQGYLFSCPVSVAEFEKRFLQKR